MKKIFLFSMILFVFLAVNSARAEDSCPIVNGKTQCGLVATAVSATPKDNTFGKTLSGKILLAVEDQGKAYYVDFNGQAHYLQDADSAFLIMRNLAQGINKSGSQRIKKNDKAFTMQHRGKLFLSVEESGEVYYIDFNGNSHYLKDGLTAYRVMRGLSLGITNANLAKITIVNQLPEWVDDTRKAVDVTNPVKDSGVSSIDQEKAKATVLDFINNYLLSGKTAEISSIDLMSIRLFKLGILLDGETITSYLTEDGQIFFAEGMNIAETKELIKNSETEEAQSTEVVKTARPVVELFVMSHCPYGTQMEKGILPVVEALGDKIDFQLKFVDYAMHGEKEINEQLSQYCIQEQGQKMFRDYLNCFLIDGDSERCLTETKVDQVKLKACTDKTDQTYKINELFADESTWQGGYYPQFNIYKTDNEKYGVGGSPTLIVNGVETNSSRDSAGLLSSICSAFTEKPAECNTQLSSASPSPGFGTGTTTNNTASQCE